MAPASEKGAQASSKRIAARNAESSGPGRYDGGDDDGIKAEADEDLINSDLDDDDDDEDEIGADDGQTGELMLWQVV